MFLHFFSICVHCSKLTQVNGNLPEIHGSFSTCADNLHGLYSTGPAKVIAYDSEFDLLLIFFIGPRSEKKN